jgi:SpoVK/Ycf46/Vps4 family AAA+-type ATPase
MNDQHDLTLILKSRFPLVIIETPEEPRVSALIERIANLEDLPLFKWSAADGIKRHNKSEPIGQTYEFAEALRYIDKTQQNGIYLLFDAHPYLDNPLNLRMIREIAMEYHKCERTLVFVSNQIELPSELQRMSASFKLSLPDQNQLRQLFKEEMELWANRNEGMRLSGKQEAAELLIQHLVGMSKDDARRLIRQSMEIDGAITMEDVARVLKHKHESLGAGVLALEMDTGSFKDVGGQQQFKRWLELRRAPFVGDASAMGLDIPKGVLLLGVQGGGKSLAAKALAGSWGLPLLRLDFGALYNKFHGETERNVREALDTAGSMAPCILWIDEIEKGLSTDEGSSDGGVSRRVLGSLLTWMSERKKRVFLVATANNIEHLPPELLRKGRFDEIFFVDLPDQATRIDIFRIHLTRRKHEPNAFDLAELANQAEGFSGAEIEQAVVASLYEAHATSSLLTTEHILGELKRTKPLSIVRAEEMRALRDWASDRTVMAH